MPKWLRGLDKLTLPRSKSRVQIPSPAPEFQSPPAFPHRWTFSGRNANVLYRGAVPKW
jgi:hypothetical protein